MPNRLDKALLLERMGPFLAEKGLARVALDAAEPTAQAAGLALAGLPHYEQIWAGDLRSVVVLVAVVSGEQVSVRELARRAELLSERAEALAGRLSGAVLALQIVVYERKVLEEERELVLREGRKAGHLLRARGKVATWIFAMDELALHASRFPGWPPELSPSELRKLLFSPAA